MKIRFKTWYRGKWVYAGSYLGGSIVRLSTDGFEPYIEEIHGTGNDTETAGVSTGEYDENIYKA